MAKNADAAKEVKAVIKKRKEEEKKKQPEQQLEAAKQEEKQTAKQRKAEEKKKTKEAIKKGAKEEKVKEERIYTFNLKAAWKAPRQRRTRTAVKVLKNLIRRHTKKEPKLHESLNSEIWKNSARNPPRKIKVKLKITDTTATAYPSN